MESNKNFGPIVILLLTAAIALGIYMVKSGHTGFLGNIFGNDSIKTTLQASVKGELVENFPQGLILPVDARVLSSSNTLIDEQNTNVLSATFSTKSTIADLFAAYSGYFTDNGFKLILSDSKLSSSRLAAKGSKYAVAVTSTYLNAEQNQVRIDVTMPAAPISQ